MLKPNTVKLYFKRKCWKKSDGGWRSVYNSGFPSISLRTAQILAWNLNEILHVCQTGLLIRKGLVTKQKTAFIDETCTVQFSSTVDQRSHLKSYTKCSWGLWKLKWKLKQSEKVLKIKVSMLTMAIIILGGKKFKKHVGLICNGKWQGWQMRYFCGNICIIRVNHWCCKTWLAFSCPTTTRWPGLHHNAVCHQDNHKSHLVAGLSFS